jgi:hypothetical protein
MELQDHAATAATITVALIGRMSYANAYVFGAICPARDTGAALVLPRADAGAMQLHLDHISRCVAGGAHAVITLDKAGWHTTRKLHVPSNISLLHLPPASPELNPTENI